MIVKLERKGKGIPVISWGVKNPEGKVIPLHKVGRCLLSTWSPEKTHWLEYWEVPITFGLVRIINVRDNISTSEVPFSEVAISSEEEEMLMKLLSKGEERKEKSKGGNKHG